MWNLTEQNCGRTSGEWRSRREYLRIGTLGLTGMTRADLLLARAGGAEQSTLTKKTSVILLFLVFWIERLELRSAPPFEIQNCHPCDSANGIARMAGAVARIESVVLSNSS